MAGRSAQSKKGVKSGVKGVSRREEVIKRKRLSHPASGSASLEARLEIALAAFSDLAAHYCSSARDRASKARRVEEVERQARHFQRLVLKALDYSVCPPGTKSCGQWCISVRRECPQGIGE
jgi:hypothetical protein